AMDEQAKKTVLRHFTYGLFALASGSLERPSAMTVNWICQTSFEPPLVAVALEQDARTLEAVRATGRFTVTAYAEGQRELAGQLGRRSAKAPNKLDGLDLTATDSGL